MAINKVVMNTSDGEETLIDLTNDSVTPETLAEGVTAHDASGEQIVGTMVASEGGGPVSWDDVTDKPVVIEGGDTLTWDGNTEGLVVAGDVFYKVSDVTPSLADFANGGTVCTNGAYGDFPASEVTEDGGIISIGSVAAVVTEDAVGVDFDGLVFTEAGVYFTYAPGFVEVTSLTIPGYTGFGQEKIAPSHLYQPDWNQTDETAADFIKNKPFGDKKTVLVDEQTVVFDNGIGGVVANAAPSVGGIVTVVYNGTAYTCTVQDVMGFAAVGNLAIMEMGDDTGEPFFGLWFDSTYLEMNPLALDESEAVVKIEGDVTTKIPEKYYDKMRLLYTDGTYLYSDGTLSAKLTAADFLTIMATSPAMLIFDGQFTLITSGGLSGDYGYADCTLWGNTLTLYTAEYTPETT